MSQPRSATAIDRSAIAFTFCAIAMLIGGVGWLAGAMWPVVLDRIASDGVVVTIWLFAAAGIGAAILRAGKISCQSKALLFATAAGIGFGVISLITLLLGICGALSRQAAIVILAIGLTLGIVTLFLNRANWRKPRAEFLAANWAWLVVIPFVVIAIVSALVPAGILWGDEPNGYDVVEYHLQVPREWFEAGRIAPLSHNVFSYFPMNVEMHYLLAMELRGGPWAGMCVAQLMHVVFVGLSVVTVYGVLKSTAKPQAAIIGAVIVGATPWMMMLAGIAYDEGGLLLFGSLSIAWAILAKDSQRKIKLIALAGVFAGLACGVKLTAVPMVLLAISIAMFAMFDWRQAIKSAAVFAIAGLIAFSPWLIRNAVWTGNPVFPEAMTILGRGHFSDSQVKRWDSAHRPREDQRNILGRIDAVGSQIFGDWRYGFVELPLAILAFALSRKRTETRFLFVIFLINAIFWIAFTHLQGRFFVLSIPIAGMLIGQVEDLRWQLLAIGGAITSAVIG
ncbi:MAG TPA: glycosyltransferase family 39 protein, partial [Tepidisphaeraceae bacterium]|nr:glycosyltransferase family 39 protein [Tepidisphaeraceae bacterium]